METEITKHNNDILMKIMAENFKDKALAFLGLETASIVSLIPTVLPVIEAKESRSDLVFLLEDNTLLHLEFQTTVSIENLKRFLLYDARIINKDEHEREINTAVIYSGHIEQAPEKLKKGSISYNVINVYMKDYDGDEEYGILLNKIINNEPLEEMDVLKLIFLPLMKSKVTEEEMALKAAELAKETDESIRFVVFASLIVITDKFMSDGNKRKLLEVLKMTQIEQWIRAEGREEREIEIARTALREGAEVDFVVRITGLDRKTVIKLKEEPPGNG